MLPSAGAFGQAPVVGDGYLADPNVGETIVEPVINPVVGAYGPELDHGGPPVIDGQPVNWISGPYFKAGVALGFTDDLLDNPESGYTITGGFRQPLSPALDERLFLDLGGSYLSAFGATTQAKSGVETTLNAAGNVVNIRNVNFTETLDEIQRAGVHFALGWYWGDVIDRRSDDPQLRFATRFGGRIAHTKGQFSDTRNDVPVLGGFPIPPNSRTITIADHDTSDTTEGAFAGLELLLLNRDFSGGSVQLVLDSEYSYEFVDFSGWGSGSLGVATITTGFMFSR